MRDPVLWADQGEPEAHVERVGRWMWCIRITHGITEQVPYSYALGKKHAERKARRQLARYIRRNCEPRNTFVVAG